MNKNSPLAHVLSLFGDNQTRLAEALSKVAPEYNLKPVSQPRLWHWIQKDLVPAEYCGLFEIVTNGKVRRYDLRPDLFPRPANAKTLKERIA